jgi:predicted phosphate transport protein (TIGR00153 family)
MARFATVRKDQQFLSLFEEAGINLQQAAGLLSRLMVRWPDQESEAREILLCEQEGDRITHDIIERLNSKAGTSFDRQDLHELASALDDIVDYIEETADLLGLYRVEAPLDRAQEMSKVLREACDNVAAALASLRDPKGLNEYFLEIDRLEHEGDRIEREALAALFADGIDPIVVIRWKDIFERLEEGIDACKRVSHVLRGIVVKQS